MTPQSPQSTSAATLLQLAWLASPALPVGGFSYSEGLESAVELGRVRDAEGVAAWLDDQLQLALARNELPVVVRAVDAWHTGQSEAVVSLNEWVHATRESAELRRQTQQMGRSLLAWLRLRLPEDDDRLAALAALHPAPSWPVAFALAASDGGAGPREAGLAYAFGWAENMVQAAIKLVPLGQGAGQRVLGRLVAAIPDAVDRALDLPDSERQAFAPMLAILSAQHETQYSRLFRS